MNKKTLLSLSVFTALFVLGIIGCTEDPLFNYRFWINNKADKNIAFIVGENYPDTSIPEDNSSLQVMRPGTRAPFNINEDFSSFYSKLPKDTLSVFFFDAALIDTVSWDSVRNFNLLIKRWDLSLADLDSAQFDLTYP